jgi:hypothetical protein
VAVWSSTTTATPPRYTIGGPNGLLQKPRGLDLDPEHNAIVSDSS